MLGKQGICPGLVETRRAVAGEDDVGTTRVDFQREGAEEDDEGPAGGIDFQISRGIGRDTELERERERERERESVCAGEEEEEGSRRSGCV